MIDPDLLERMESQNREKPKGLQKSLPGIGQDADLAKSLRERAGAAYSVGDDRRAQRLRRAAELVEGRET